MRDDQHLVFVGGLHRSGTTLLAQLLGAHPDATNLTGTGVSHDEGQYLQTTYRRDAELGGAGRFAFDSRATPDPAAERRSMDRVRVDLLRAWTPYWDMSRRFLIEKTPANCLHAPYLQSVFPGRCTFVFVTRHPIANALATRKWSGTSLFALLEHWHHAHELMRAHVGGLERVAWISYEELIVDTPRVIAELQAFVGMRRVALGPRSLPDLNSAYFGQWNSRYGSRIAELPGSIRRGEPTAAGACRRLLWRLRARTRRSLLRLGIDVLSTGREAAAVIARYEDRVRELGYSLVDTALAPPPAVQSCLGRFSSFGALNTVTVAANDDVVRPLRGSRQKSLPSWHIGAGKRRRKAAASRSGSLPP